MRLFLSAAFAMPLSAQEAKADVIVSLAQPSHRISPHLYGVFFEEINHAGEGGLWAQLVRNPTFEEPGTPDDPLPGWSVTRGEDKSWDLRRPPKAELTPSDEQPANAAAPRHARIEVIGWARQIGRA